MKKISRIVLVFILAIFIILSSGCIGFTKPPASVPLEKPTYLTFNQDTLTLSWNTVINAKQYDINVVYDSSIIKEAKTALLTLPLDASLFIGKSGTFTFSVTALGYDNFLTSQAATTTWNRVIPTLSQTTNIDYSYETGFLSWESVINADSYAVSCSYSDLSVSIETTETIYDFSEFKAITPLSFSIVSMSNNIDFNPSNPALKIVYIKLAGPDSLFYNRSQTFFGTLTWTPVIGATSYDVFYEHAYKTNSGLLNVHRSPSNAASISYYTVTEASFPLNLLYSTNPLVSITFYVRATAKGYTSSPYTKYIWYPS